MSACCNNANPKNRKGWRRLLNSRMTIVLGLVAVAGGGLAVGGWGWLVAAGLAPIILSLLPCLVMCGLGLCMMGMNRSKSPAAPVIDAAIQNGDSTVHQNDLITSPAVPSIGRRQSQNAT